MLSKRSVRLLEQQKVLLPKELVSMLHFTGLSMEAVK